MAQTVWHGAPSVTQAVGASQGPVWLLTTVLFPLAESKAFSTLPGCGSLVTAALVGSPLGLFFTGCVSSLGLGVWS